jgi:SAM-dependent methyltransferase
LLYEVVIPAVIKMIEETGDLGDRRICDLACGQGVIARQLAQRGAQVVGIDISERLLVLAKSEEASARHPITYMRDDAQVASTLEDASVDGVVCNMALMDIPDLDATCRTVHRVLRSGGWFVFAITHPYVQMHHSRWVTRDDGTVTREAGDYFAEGFWRPTDAPGVRGQVGSHHRMLSTYLNTLASAHLTLEHVVEPCGSEALLQQMPGYRRVPAAFLARCRKAS